MSSSKQLQNNQKALRTNPELVSSIFDNVATLPQQRFYRPKYLLSNRQVGVVLLLPLLPTPSLLSFYEPSPKSSRTGRTTHILILLANIACAVLVRPRIIKGREAGDSQQGSFSYGYCLIKNIYFLKGSNWVSFMDNL